MNNYSVPLVTNLPSRPETGASTGHMEMQQETLRLLQSQFADCPNLIPISVIGDNIDLKASILAGFTRVKSAQLLRLQIGEDTLLSVYPRPVQVGNHQLLLFDMPDPDFLDENKQKMLHAVFSVTSICIVCMKSAELFPNLNKMYKLYATMLPNCGFKLSKFFVCVDDFLLALQGRQSAVQAQLGDFYEFWYFGNGAIFESAFNYMSDNIRVLTFSGDYSLADSRFHKNLASYYNTMLLPIYSLLRLLGSLLQFSNRYFTFLQYLAKLPNFNETTWLQDQERVENQLSHIDLSHPAVSLIKMYFGDKNSAQTSYEGIRMLREQLAWCPNIIPIAVIGHPGCGKSLILDQFAVLGEVNQPFSLFGECSGVIILPTPVQIGKYQFLFMEMSVDFINEEDKEKVLLMKKVLFALMSITSVCIFCFEKGSLFPQLDEIFDLYRDMRQKCHVEVSKFFICVENKPALDKPPLSRGYKALKNNGEFNEMCEFFYRGSDGISEDCFNYMILKLREVDFHRKYEESHRIWQNQGYSGVELIIGYIEVLVRLANLDLSLERYIENAVVYDRPDWLQQINPIETQEIVIQGFTQAKALPLFTRIQGSVELDFESIETIKKYFYLQEPIIILCIIGNQGLGKSTLLNHIIQHILQSRKKQDVFKVGNTQDHTTRNSQVLSQPLRLKSSNRQLMLIDLEGLGGMETTDEEEKILQTNLASDILVLSSVYCIILRNELTNLDFVKEIIGRISLFRTVFGFQVQRIYLLFHDKKKDSAGTNYNLVSEVNRLNQVYFSGAEVVLIINKPSFVSTETTQMRQQFLEELVHDIDHPKLKQDGRHFSVLELLELMDFRLQKERYSGESNLTRRGKEEADAMIDAKLQKMTKSNETAVKQITIVDSIGNLGVICETERELRGLQKSEMFMQYVLKSLLIKQGRKQPRPELRKVEASPQVKPEPVCALF